MNIVPAMICYLGFYLMVKQQESIRQIARFNFVCHHKCVSWLQTNLTYRCIVQINQNYARIMSELVQYNGQLSNFLTVFPYGCIILITYFIYCIFYTKISYEYLVLTVLLLIIHIINLFSFIWVLAKCNQMNNHYTKICQQAIITGQREQLFHQKRLLKVVAFFATKKTNFFLIFNFSYAMLSKV